ncbi:hypothetical protein MKJ04_07920 [Pontibacter sp. E15-1]|uniref:hypothetical protein n=1 Tax=Pontibacter sp. E15-1 TaxID=2919918 RepID=UPI001F4FDE0C|nr:hypothetical protein [Pontibacter sp. E15-1]MCJ8164767.1 hypothetical protein [Pontibacter sp. E15-1]
MKKTMYMLLATGLLTFSGCASTEKTVEDTAEEVEDEVEDAADEVEDEVDR